MSRHRICVVASAQYTVEVFLLDQLRQFGARHDVTLYVMTSEPDFLRQRGIDVRVIPAPIERQISLLRDLQGLWFLWREFRANRYELVHSVTPKGGLLAMLAARLAGNSGPHPHLHRSGMGQPWRRHASAAEER